MQKWEKAIMEGQINTGGAQREKLAFELRLKSM